jgi:hypothetical protein
MLASLTASAPSRRFQQTSCFFASNPSVYRQIPSAMLGSGEPGNVIAHVHQMLIDSELPLALGS